MGGEALVIACVGDDDLGHLELATLRAEGVETVGVTLIPGASTDVAIVMVDDEGENTVLAINRTNQLLTGRAVESALHPHWGTLDAILTNFECSEGSVAATVRLGKAHNIPVVVDAGPIRGYGPETWRDATVLSPNAQEAAALVGMASATLQEDKTARRAAGELLAAGPEAIVLKRGSRGALLLTKRDDVLVPSFPVKVVDTTGAGDAFSAALTLALAEGKPLPETVRYANAAGALAVTQFGTLEAMPTRATVNALLRHPPALR
jgi:ribokinase